MSNKDNNGVGYKNPPKHTQFKKGQPSANPKGRPKKAESLGSILADVLGEQVAMAVNGRPKRATKKKVFVRQWVHDAIKSDGRSRAMLLKMLQAEGPGGQLIPAPTPEELEKREQLSKKISDMLNKMASDRREEDEEEEGEKEEEKKNNQK